MLQFPLGMSTFADLRNDGYVYVDKTENIHKLITQGRRYFLSRPRRFGKSLLVSTLKEVLVSNKPLFKDLWIEKSNYQWPKHGVILLNFSAIGVTNAATLHRGLCKLLQEIADDYKLELTLDTQSSEDALRSLVRALHAKFDRVAILVDEYDSPILKHLENTPQAKEICDAIRSFFTAVKGLDEYIKFTFITGVSSFAKAGIFSGLNNLEIITLRPEWATICGYTDPEIDQYFAPHIQAWAEKENIPYDDMRMKIRQWYNGYHFGANSSSVYNPFSLMSSLKAQDFENFWLATGTPSFLIKELEKNYRTPEIQMLNLDSLETTADILGTFEVGKTPLAALMFQTGYLTITGFVKEDKIYKLGYPNYEVRTTSQKYLLGVYASLEFDETNKFALDLVRALKQKNIPEVVSLIKSMITRVPYPLHMKEEKFYHGLLQVLFGAAGLKAYSEHMTSHARIDMVIELPAVNYLLEVKFNESAEKALEQIEDRKYYEALKYQNKPIILLGLAFHRQPKEFDITYAFRELLK